jgi:hypothetical protein
VAALLFIFAAAILVAQGTPADNRPPEKQSASAAATEQSSASTKAGNESAKPEESAKSEDENAQFKHSPSVQWIGRKLKISTDSAYRISVAINFAIVIAFLWFALTKKFPLAGGMSAWARGRTATIQKGMEEARRTSEDANRRLA